MTDADETKIQRALAGGLIFGAFTVVAIYVFDKVYRPEPEALASLPASDPQLDPALTPPAGSRVAGLPGPSGMEPGADG